MSGANGQNGGTVNEAMAGAHAGGEGAETLSAARSKLDSSTPV